MNESPLVFWGGSLAGAVSCCCAFIVIWIHVSAPRVRQGQRVGISVRHLGLTLRRAAGETSCGACRFLGRALLPEPGAFKWVVRLGSRFLPFPYGPTRR